MTCVQSCETMVEVKSRLTRDSERVGTIRSSNIKAQTSELLAASPRQISISPARKKKHSQTLLHIRGPSSHSALNYRFPIAP